MDISPSPVGSAVQIAVQARMLAQMKTQGADIAAMIASAPSAAGSVNLPGQGLHLDVRV